MFTLVIMTDNMMKVTILNYIKNIYFTIDQRLSKSIKHTYKVARYVIIKT